RLISIGDRGGEVAGVGLLLQADEVVDACRWRWLLRDGDGRTLAEHAVSLTPGTAELAAFADLYGYLRWHADVDRRVEHEAEIVDRLGGGPGGAGPGAR